MNRGRKQSDKDGPRALPEIEERLSTEEMCRSFIWRLRWPNGFQLHRCWGEHAWPNRRRVMWECGCSHHQTPPPAETVLLGLRKPSGCGSGLPGAA